MHTLIIKREISLPLAFIGFSLILIGTLLKITHSSILNISNNFILGCGSAIMLLIWFIAVSDAIKNGVKNQIMWIIAFLFFGSVASIVYLMNREHIILKKK